METIYPVNRVQFGILSPEEIVKLSVVEITKPLTYENGLPVVGGLNDQRMGVIEFGEQCKTCMLKQDMCPGHFGHITLETPIFNSLFISGSRVGNSVSIKSVLESVCVKCAKLLVNIPENIHKIKAKNRMIYIKNLIGTNKECQSDEGCGSKQPKYTFDKFNELYFSYEGSGTRDILRPEYVMNLFKKIENKTVEAMGINPKYARPEWMILTHLLVPPPSLRPSIKSDVAKHEDDLVTVFIDIIKQNNNLKKVKERGQIKTIQEYEKLLNLYITSMMVGKSKTGDAAISFSTGGKPIKPIKERISAKEGRIRGNLMGKRVDFSARTVITPDPNLSMNEIGVPYEIAKTLSFPEVVNDFNKDFLYRLVMNGTKKYPGANKIISRNGGMKYIKYLRPDNIVLENGDTVERHLMNGDMILFNRQPSLHKMSMMGFHVVVLPEMTFRMNPAVCGLFNADFDGDQKD